MKIRNAEILCVGTELLLGEVINTNVAYIGRALARLGISVYHTSVVGDNSHRLEEAVKSSLEHADLLILTGGLGPTYDDLTKETVASALGLPMVRDENILAEIEGYFSSIGLPMPANNAKQADIPKGGFALPNKHGTAPGIFVEHEGHVVVLLPGPPTELHPMFDEFVFPRLREMSDMVLVSHNIHIMGMGESAIEEVLFNLMKNSQNPTLAPYAKESEVRLRVSALANSEEEGEKMCAEMIEKVKNSPVGKHIYALDAEHIENLVISKLKENKLTLSVAESCTGGYIGKLLTDVPGASSAFGGGFITYSNEAKIKLLGVSPDTLQKYTAVSPETAMEMASGARERLGTNLAVSVTGEAGPNSDPSTGKAVGTVFVGISSVNKTYAVQVKIPPQRNRDYIRNVAANRALREILKFLNEI